ncbi:HalOD1 output domain-containing protein [Natronomonas gomsonensis]|uniref:HalOD1 output domain-containing protein n=1 Tax=Natronomonas gomsonensis TaxID=1046043 RepID=UPI0015BBF315|nr:HalOD1 output domain-containing protein [Natronomonas gomsonensis]
MENRGELLVYRGCTPVVDAEYDSESDSSATEAIISALAEAVGVEPTNLPPLFDYVDPDALNALFEPSDSATNGDTLLSFQVDTWNVFVRSDGRIRVCDATQPTDPEPVFESTTA